MSELHSLVTAVCQLRERDEPFLSATVVRVRGSGYRRAGARMIASRDQWLAGSISGGCLERDVTAKGFWRTRTERALLVTYDDSEAALDERSGSGCQGIVDVLLERCEPSDARAMDVFAAAERCLREELPAASITVFRSTRQDLAVGSRLILQGGEYVCAPRGEPRGEPGCEYLRREFAREAEAALEQLAPAYVTQRIDDAGEIEALVECIVPPAHLFVFGAGHDATPVVTLAKSIGWTVSVWDALPRNSARERLLMADQYLAGSLQDAVERLSRCLNPAAVVMGHHLEQDRAALAALLPSSARYIGVLGPRRRTEELLADCRAAGVVTDADVMKRVYAPVGLRLGAESPAEIALAIVAEAQAALTQSEGSTLRSQAGSIHPRATPAPRDESQSQSQVS
jgi:xanthine/CO dehydrogenase XdhC/CoxF family maturation factor